MAESWVKVGNTRPTCSEASKSGLLKLIITQFTLNVTLLILFCHMIVNRVDLDEIIQEKRLDINNSIFTHL